jgi:chromosome segregation ATPase
MDQCREEKSSLEQRMEVLEEFRGRCSRLQLEVERQRSQAQQYANRLEGKSREIERLTTALRNVDDDVKQERERQDVLIARLRASVCFNRIFIFRVIPIGFFLGTADRGDLGSETPRSGQTAQNGT